MRHGRLLIDGGWTAGVDTLDVHDKYSGAVIGRVDVPSREQADAAIRALRVAFEARELEPYDRYRILRTMADLVERRVDDLAPIIAAEAGIPISDARNEVHRSVQTLSLSAEEAKRIAGEMVPIEAAPGQAHRMAFTIRVPRGVVCAISAFNSPLNMVAHKVAPALAAGNTVVIKPPEVAPLTAVTFCELLIEAGLPASHLALLQGPGATVGAWLAEHRDIAFYSFTGSTKVGQALRAAVGLRPVALELGSVSATIVCEDADLDRAATRCAGAGFRRAGQMCTSTQRLYVHASVLDRFVERLIAATSALKVGNPLEADTAIGPMISERDAARAERWIQEACTQGAVILHGGRREGALLHPTILTLVTPSMRVMCEEIFAPVLSIVPYDSLDAVIAQINASDFGLAAGVFTRDLARAMDVSRRVQVGVLHVNEASASRVDLLPFGGVKQSGLGREGPRYAIQEMTQERLITMSLR